MPQKAWNQKALDFGARKLRKTWNYAVKNQMLKPDGIADETWQRFLKRMLIKKAANGNSNLRKRISKGKLPNECILLKTKQENDRPRINIKKTKGKRGRMWIYAHQLAAIAADGLPDAAKDGGEKDTSSHLCNKADCVNPAHLCLESYKLNRSRWCCVEFLNNLQYKCPHYPPCVGYPKERQCN